MNKRPPTARACAVLLASFLVNAATGPAGARNNDLEPRVERLRQQLHERDCKLFGANVSVMRITDAAAGPHMFGYFDKVRLACRAVVPSALVALPWGGGKTGQHVFVTQYDCLSPMTPFEKQQVMRVVLASCIHPNSHPKPYPSPKSPPP